ncbi:MAG: hypothetical protein WED15_07120 [Akkermansiaceae bacterium]
MKSFALLFILSVLTVAARAEQPDLVIFLSDDHTWRDSSVYGSPDIKRRIWSGSRRRG